MATIVEEVRSTSGSEVKEYPMFVAGRWQTSDDVLEVRSPYSGDLIGVTYQASRDQLEDAIVAAERAFEAMRTMPTYEYRCRDCGHEFEAVQSFSDDALTECPQCTGTLRKVFGSIGVTFKGSGFYKNDHGSRAKSGSTASTSTSSGESSSSGDSSSSSASTPSTPAATSSSSTD